MRRSWPRTHAVTAVLPMFASLIGWSGVSTSTPAAGTRSAPDDTILYMTSNDESIFDGLAMEASKTEKNRAVAKRLVNEWLTLIEDGQPVEGLGSPGVEQHRLLKRFSLQLSGPSKVRSAPMASREASAPVPVPQASGLNPNAFAVRGTAAGADRSYWHNLKLAVGAGRCDRTGCKETDRFDLNVTVNPGAKTSKITSLGVLSLNSGRFQNAHLEIWALNRGVNVGLGDTGSVYGRTTNFRSSSRYLNNDVLTIAVALWVFDLQAERYGYSAGKTADARCRPPGDNRCFF